MAPELARYRITIPFPSPLFLSFLPFSFFFLFRPLGKWRLRTVAPRGTHRSGLNESRRRVNRVCVRATDSDTRFAFDTKNGMLRSCSPRREEEKRKAKTSNYAYPYSVRNRSACRARNFANANSLARDSLTNRVSRIERRANGRAFSAFRVRIESRPAYGGARIRKSACTHDRTKSAKRGLQNVGRRSPARFTLAEKRGRSSRTALCKLRFHSVANTRNLCAG